MTQLDFVLPRGTNNAEGQLLAGISASEVTIIMNSGEGDSFPTAYKNFTTSAGTDTVLNFTGIQALSVANVGDFVENLTDGSHAQVISISADSITTSKLKGGSLNTWGNGDEFAINRFIITLNKRDDSGIITASEKVLIDKRTNDTLYTVVSQRGYAGDAKLSFDADDYVNLFITNEIILGVMKALAELSTEKADLSTVIDLLNARNYKANCIAATTADIDLSTEAEAGDTIDGVTLSEGDRLLVKDQTDQTENGIYEVQASGSPVRTEDADTSAELTQALVPIVSGTSNKDTLWLQITDEPEIGVDNIVWSQAGASVEKASTAEAIAGVDDSKYMTPKTNKEANALSSHKFTALETWNAVTSLSTTEIIQVLVDASQVTNGLIEVEYAGANKLTVNAGDTGFVLAESASTLDILATDETWKMDSATYDTKLKSVSAQESSPQDVKFSEDGSKMYIIGATNKTVYQYTVSTPWDVSTAAYASKLFNPSLGDPTGLFFSDDGTKMYISDNGSNSIYWYSLSTPWDVSTASLVNSKSVTAQAPAPYGVAFKSDGSIMYVCDGGNIFIYQYTLGTPWDITTAVYASKSLGTTTQEGSPQDVFLKPDGTSLYIVGVNNDTVYQYDMSTPFDLSTASYSGFSSSVASQETNPKGLAIGNGGQKLYIVGSTNATVYQYTVHDAFSGTGFASFKY